LPEIATVDVFFAVEPDSAEVAIRLARRFGGRAIFDIHENYHKEMLDHWVPRWIRPLASLAVLTKLRSISRRVELVMGPCGSRVLPYEPQAAESMVVRHCLKREAIQKFAAKPFQDGRGPVRIMHGRTWLVHGTCEVVRGVALAEKRLRDGPPLRLVCIDDFGPDGARGRQVFSELLKAEKAEHLVELNPIVPFSKMLQMLSACDIGVIAYGRAFGVNCFPNRLFEYMAVGIPAIVPSYAVELQPFIERYHCGLAVDTERAEAIADGIVTLVRDREAAQQMGRAGREGSLAELNLENEIQPLIEWIRRPSTKAGIGIPVSP